MRIERAGSADAVAAVQPLFDHALRPEAVERVLGDPTHHLLVAYTGDTAPPGLDAEPACYDAKVLITEMSFIREQHRRCARDARDARADPDRGKPDGAQHRGQDLQ